MVRGYEKDGDQKDKRQKIIQVAREVFDRYGLRKVTLEDIASSVGMAVSSLYYYFPSKTDLFREVLLTEHEEFMQELGGRLSTAADAEQKLYELSRLMFEKLRRLSRLPGMTRSERLVISDFAREARRFRQSIVDLIEEILREGVAQGLFEVENPTLAARMFAAGLRGLFETVLDGEFPENDLEGLESMCGLLVRGLRKR